MNTTDVMVTLSGIMVAVSITAIFTSEKPVVILVAKIAGTISVLSFLLAYYLARRKELQQDRDKDIYMALQNDAILQELKGLRQDLKLLNKGEKNGETKNND